MLGFIPDSFWRDMRTITMRYIEIFATIGMSRLESKKV